MVWTTNGRRYVASCLNSQSAPESTSSSISSTKCIELKNVEGTAGYYMAACSSTAVSAQNKIISLGSFNDSSGSSGTLTISGILTDNFSGGSYSRVMPKFGTNDDSPHVSDYTLTLPTNCSYVVTRNPRSSQDDYSLSYSLSITNNDTASVTIKEIGLLKTGSNSTSTTSSYLPVTTKDGSTVISYTTLANAGAVLLTRDLLSTPLVIPAGETRSLTYRIDYSNIFS